MGKFGDSFNWFKGLSCCAKIFLIAGVVVTAVGAIGYFVWYWAWYSHYSELYGNIPHTDKPYRDALPDNTNLILDCILAGCIMAVIVIVAIIVAFFMWFFISNGLIWKIVMLVAVAGSVGCVIVGFILAAKTNADFAEDIGYEDQEKLPGCYTLALYDVKQVVEGEKYSKIWCEESIGRNLSMCLILIVGIVLDFIGFCIAK